MRITFLRLIAVEHSDPRERRSWGETGYQSRAPSKWPLCRKGAKHCSAHRTKRKAPRVLHHAEPETERRPGAGGRRGPPLVQCVKQDRGDMVPVDEVEKQTLMLEPPCRIRISAFRRRKKASAEPHACPVAAWVPVQSPADPTAQTCRGHVWRTKAKPLALLLAADGFALFGCVIRVGSLTAPSFIYRGKG